MCFELHKTPDEIRRISSTDFINLIANRTIGNEAHQPLAWDDGGEDVLTGWVEAMNKRKPK